MLTLRWIPSEENSEADKMTQSDVWEHVRTPITLQQLTGVTVKRWHGPHGFRGILLTSPNRQEDA